MTANAVPPQKAFLPHPAAATPAGATDQALEFREYERKRPTKNVQALLDHIGSGGDPIFWG